MMKKTLADSPPPPSSSSSSRKRVHSTAAENASINRRRPEFIIDQQQTSSQPTASPASAAASPSPTASSAASASSSFCSTAAPASSTTQTAPWAISQGSHLDLQRVLKGNFLFSGMSDMELKSVIQTLIKLEANTGETIIREGDLGEFMYILESGSLEVFQANAPGVSDVLVKDCIFGELAVLSGKPRAATVRALEPSHLWKLSLAELRALSTNLNDNLLQRVDKLRKVTVFRDLTFDQMRRVCAVMKEERFPPGAVICQQGEAIVSGHNDKFYTIDQGKVNVTSAALPRRASNRNVLLSSPTSSKSLVSATVGTPTSDSAPALKWMEDKPATPTQQPQAAAAAASINSEVNLGTLERGDWFGEIALTSVHTDDDGRTPPRRHQITVVALGNLGGNEGNETVCYSLSRSAFDQIVSTIPAAQIAISGSNDMRQADNHETKMKRHKQDLADSLVVLNQLELGVVIGQGGFSVVRICTHRETGEMFALKTMNKKDLLNRRQIGHVNSERLILQSISHPFVLSLWRTFQNSKNVFMVLEFIQGGELFSRVLESKGGLPASHARFYAACVVEGLEYLHRKRIAYRDLKLENLVIGVDGYLKIIDFGFAKQIPMGEYTRTLCGTPEYLAPEAVMRSGHDFQVDCWGFGVLLYEMLTQSSPFSDPTGNGSRFIIFHNIIQGMANVSMTELARPFKNLLDQQAKAGEFDREPSLINKVYEQFDQVHDVLKRVWIADPKVRATAKDIKQMDYFKSVDWVKLRELGEVAPWVPIVHGAADLRHFDVASFQSVKELDDDFDGDPVHFADWDNAV
ncbi:hypothetical protein BASA81_008726 [Batrachochytrium salamandrivorans]|nr:hypothetical protein BASA81_008726 [Batrachochytrium salamandrivorans]